MTNFFLKNFDILKDGIILLIRYNTSSSFYYLIYKWTIRMVRTVRRNKLITLRTFLIFFLLTKKTFRLFYIFFSLLYHFFIESIHNLSIHLRIKHSFSFCRPKLITNEINLFCSHIYRTKSFTIIILCHIIISREIYFRKHILISFKITP